MPTTSAYQSSSIGFAVDHINVLACGGADDNSNTRWSTIVEVEPKGKWERSVSKK
jgi:hypothetical protein